MDQYESSLLCREIGVLPGRYFGVILLELDVSSQKIFPTAIFVTSILVLAIGHSPLLFLDGPAHEPEYPKGCLDPEPTLECVPDAVLAQGPVKPGNLCQLRKVSYICMERVPRHVGVNISLGQSSS